ncbi:hypothetical protein FCM35_KLT12349 [Carex littledalei]|uniref:RNase H type-1 domain-containing protein n=1 Tax=Carex littledalei TaxID=544730 RepID=A0A833QQ28_9POAL|nr:hypothetical protein FCM35_KLT12349 [Carex littledalei]
MFNPGPDNSELVSDEPCSTGLGGVVCYVDGSWSQDGLAGVGLCLVQDRKVIAWVSKKVVSDTPSQSEAVAILEGYKLLSLKAGQMDTVFSDSKGLVHALAS